MIHKLVFLCLLLVPRAYAQTGNFIDQMPYSFRMNETTLEDLKAHGFDLDETYVNYNYEWLLQKRREMYCYVNKETERLTGLKVWKCPKSWEKNGLRIGMQYDDFIRLADAQEWTYMVDDAGPYYRNVTMVRNGLYYWFCFPMDDDKQLGEKADRLDFVVVLDKEVADTKRIDALEGNE